MVLYRPAKRKEGEPVGTIPEGYELDIKKTPRVIQPILRALMGIPTKDDRDEDRPFEEVTGEIDRLAMDVREQKHPFGGLLTTNEIVGALDQVVHGEENFPSGMLASKIGWFEEALKTGGQGGKSG